jgi:hypothetical protein
MNREQIRVEGEVLAGEGIKLNVKCPDQQVRDGDFSCS